MSKKKQALILFSLGIIFLIIYFILLFNTSYDLMIVLCLAASVCLNVAAVNIFLFNICKKRRKPYDE